MHMSVSCPHLGQVMYASVENTIIGLGNGLWPVWHQAIIWISDGLFSIGPLGTSFSKFTLQFVYKKWACKCHLQNGSHFVLASVYSDFFSFLVM